MTKELVAQADIDAAEAFINAHGWLCEEDWRYIHEGDRLVIAKAFATVRLSAEAAIVAWLRTAAQTRWSLGDDIMEATIDEIADTLEQGKHRHG